MKCSRLLPILFCLLPLAAVVAAPATSAIKPFTATYKVLRKGSPLGVSTLTLKKNADGTWVYQSSMKAKHGLAALLGGHLDESSHFRLHDGRIESLGYDYDLHTSLAGKQRRVRVDWRAGTVSVHTGDDGDFSYKPKPGLVERHLLVLALGRAVSEGKTDIALPVAVKDRVQIQTFVVRGRENISVPAGRFDAIHVARTHDDKGYSVWFAPERFGDVPVKVHQQSGGDITMLLKSVHANTP